MRPSRLVISTVVLLAVITTVFVVGSAVIDALAPAAPRNAMVLTEPGHTGSLVRDWSVLVYQLAVMAAGVLAIIALVRRASHRMPA
jgi:hypothetical protein